MEEETGLFLANWPRWTMTVVSPGSYARRKRLCRALLQSWCFPDRLKNVNIKLKSVLKAESSSCYFKSCTNLFLRLTYIDLPNTFSQISVLLMPLLCLALKELYEVFSFLISLFWLKEGLYFCEFQLCSLVHQQLVQDLGLELEKNKL